VITARALTAAVITTAMATGDGWIGVGNDRGDAFPSGADKRNYPAQRVC
jgi:hypothetical protein